MRLRRLTHTARTTLISLTAMAAACVAFPGGRIGPPASRAAEADKAKADKAKAGEAADGFTPLFDGKTLNGWVVTRCKAEVEDGKLVIVDGNGFVRTDKIYGDYVLELDWKNRKAEKYDSGIYIRCDKPKPGKSWPDKYQINLQQGQEGTIVGHKTAKAAGLAKSGEWNHFKLTCVGKHAELEVNGKPAWKVDDLEPAQGFIGIQVEVPGGGQFEFRDIRIKPLTPPVTPEE